MIGVEYSLAPFCNWFLPSCLDIWSSADGRRVLCSYGARSMLCLLSVVDKKSVKSHDCLSLFGTANRSLLSTTRFAKYGRNASKTPLLFVGSGDGEAAVVNCLTNTILRQTKKFQNLDIPAKKILSADWLDINGELIVFYAMHSVIICWNPNTKEANPLRITSNEENKFAISCIASTSCGSLQKLAIGYMNGDLIVIYFEGMYPIKEQVFSGHNDDICCLSFGFTNKQFSEGILASVSRDGFVKVWDVFRKYNVADYKLDAFKDQHKNWFSLAFVPNTTLNKFEILIGSGNGEILGIEVPAKPPDSKIRIHKPMVYMKNKNFYHYSVIFSIAVDPKSMLCITSSLDHNLIVWDLTERKPVDSLSTFSHGVHDISLSTIDPSRVAVAVGDGIHWIKFDRNVKVVNQRRIQLQRSSKIKDVLGLAIVWHPECENRLAFGNSIGDVIVYDLNSQTKSGLNVKYQNKKSNNRTKVYGLCWGPSLLDNDESTLYSLHQSGNIYVHHITSNIIEDFTHYISDDIKRSDICWKSDFNHLSVGNDSGSVDIFEHQNHSLSFKLRIESFKKSILCTKWNTNKEEVTSNLLAVGSYDGCINCYDLNQELKGDANGVISRPKYVLKGHSDRISSISWSPYDSSRMVSVSYDKTARIWDVFAETVVATFTGHRGILYCAVWSAFDEDLIFTGGEDNYFHAWRPSKQIEEAVSNGDDKDYWPHLEGDKQSEEDKKCVAKLLRECVNKVCSELSQTNVICGANGFSDDSKVEMSSKSKKLVKKKTNKESKKSLFPLNNVIESSHRYQRIEDIESIIERMNCKFVSDDKSERVLIYGNYEDMKKFVEIESSNHTRLGNHEQRDILNLLFDIRFTVEESIKNKETNPFLASLSMSISRNHWKDSMALLADQLKNSEYELQTYRSYTLEMSVITLVSQNRLSEAIDLLISNQLYREAVIVCKAKLASEEVLHEIMVKWAKHRKLTNDLEGAVKCLTAAKEFREAADLLTARNDQQYESLISLLRSNIK